MHARNQFQISSYGGGRVEPLVVAGAGGGGGSRAGVPGGGLDGEIPGTKVCRHDPRYSWEGRREEAVISAAMGRVSPNRRNSIYIDRWEWNAPDRRNSIHIEQWEWNGMEWELSMIRLENCILRSIQNSVVEVSLGSFLYAFVRFFVILTNSATCQWITL